MCFQNLFVKINYSIGEETFKDDEDESTIVLDLPQLPLSNIEETILIVLDEPTGSPAKLGTVKSCKLTIRHNRGLFPS